MALETNENLGRGAAGFQGNGDGSGAKMIRELQGVKHSFVTGGAATANLTLTGAVAGDTVGAVLNMTDSAVVDETDATLGTDTITFATVDTSAKTLLVIWYPKPS